MMTIHNLTQIIIFIVPLYISMFLGYGSMKWWKLFSQEQCSGISRFCSLFAVPVLSLYYIIRTNLYEMSLKLFGADVLQKMIMLAVLACWYKLGPGGSIERLITIFSICTLPNALLLGLPIIKSMYHGIAAPLVVEIFLAQSVIWHPLLLIMYEYRAATIAISQQSGDAYGRDVDIEIDTIGRQGVACGISLTDTRVEEVKATGVPDVSKGHEPTHDQPSDRNVQREIDEVPYVPTVEVIPEPKYQHVSNVPNSMPFAGMMAKHIMIMVWTKLIKNPNTYSTFLGLVCAFVSSMFHVAMPLTVTRSLTFLSNASLGMGMFNMGLSMGLRSTLMPYSKVVAAMTIVLRFIIGPTVMAFASQVVKLRGTIFHIAVVQAAISQGVAPSVFAVEYNVYSEIFNIGMISGMIVVLPATLLYYNLLEIHG